MESRLRFVTWNCCLGRFDAKADALKALHPDIAVLQEVGRIAGDSPNIFWWGGDAKKGLAVVAGDGFRVERQSLHAGAPWSIVPARIVGADLSIHLLAVWARHETDYVRGVDAAVQFYAEFLRAAPAVIIGDFNANAIWDAPRKPTDFTRLGRRLESEFGLVSAYHEFFREPYGAESCPTHYFQWQRAKPFHIDYCLVPRAWQITSVAVGAYDEWASLSDHRPLIVDVAIAS